MQMKELLQSADHPIEGVVGQSVMAPGKSLPEFDQVRSETDKPKAHFDSVQAMRAYSVIAVVLFHIAMRQRQDFPSSGLHLTYPLSLIGHAGVDLFFIISGFIITTVNWHGFGRPAAIVDYLLKRIIRIFPLYWLTGLPMLLYAMTQNIDFKSAIGAFFLLPHYAGRVNQVAWSLAYEILFYAVFAVFLLLPRRRLLIGVGIWLSLIAANCMFPHAFKHPGMFQTFLRPLNLEFILGIGVALLIQMKAVYNHPRLLIGLGILGAALVAALKHYGPNPYPEYDGAVRALLFGVPAALILYGAISLECLGRFNTSKTVLLLGDASYAIYLVHFSLIQVLMLNPLALSIRQPTDLFLWEVAVFAIVLFLGVLIHLQIEKPILRKLKRRFLH